MQRSLIHQQQQQHKRGHWAEGRRSSALACLAFLGAGHTHRYGRFKEQVKRFLRQEYRRYLSREGVATGAAAPELALSALALCRSYGVSQSPILKAAATGAAIELAARCRGPRWASAFEPDGYPPGEGVLWAVAALCEAKRAKLEAPGLADALAAARKLSAAELARGCSRPATMAAAFHFAGGELRQLPASAALIKELTARPAERAEAMGAVEHWAATVVMFNAGGDAWKAWNRHIKARLVDTQNTADCDPLNGSWKPARPGDARLGRVGLAAVQTMTLQVYYRYARVLK